MNTTLGNQAPVRNLRRAALAPPPRFRAPAAVPIVTIDDGAVRGVAVPGGYAFRGLPYAAPPTSNQRWRPRLRPPIAARPTSEDCLYLNVSTPTLRSSDRDDLPVLVWIHGGGLTQDADRDYAGTRLAADGTAVFTINYRLGALGFLAHPALASRPGGPPATAG